MHWSPMRTLFALVSVVAVSAAAQDAPSAPLSATAGSQSAAICADCPIVPALTPVRIAILAPLGSKTSKTGERFPLQLAEPITLDGKVLVPAGAMGEGEVVHAKKSGGSGAAGELVLAARWLEVNGARLRLRSLKFAVVGKSAVRTVGTISVASAATVPAVSFLGLLITGGQVTVAEGTVAEAKTAEAFVVPHAADASPDNRRQQEKSE